jgi:hypothetical protein
LCTVLLINFYHNKYRIQESPTISRKVLSVAESEEIIAREDFGLFMESASRIIERTLGQNDSSIDILKNYKNDENLRSEDQILSVEAVYEDESVRSRPVMYLQSSPHFSELFLAAYGAKGVKQGKTVLGPLGGETLGSPGMVAVWSHVVSTYVWCTSLLCFFTDILIGNILSCEKCKF